MTGHAPFRPATRASYEAVVIGVSAGGLDALRTILPCLPEKFPVPVIVVQHRGTGSDDFLSQYLDQCCAVQVKETEEKEETQRATERPET